MRALDRWRIPLGQRQSGVAVGLLLLISPSWGAAETPIAAGERGQHPSLTHFGGVVREPDWSSILGLRQLAEERTERSRAHLAALLYDSKPRSPIFRLELLYAARPWVMERNDPELTLGVLRLFESKERSRTALGDYSTEVAAMLLAHAQAELGRNALRAALASSELGHTGRSAARNALSSLDGNQDPRAEPPWGWSTNQEIELERGKILRSLTEGPLHELELSFGRGNHWLAAALAERSTIDPPGLSARSMGHSRLDSFLAWLESDEIVLRLGAAGGLGRRLLRLEDSTERGRIVAALSERYRSEPEPRVRCALTIALGRAQQSDKPNAPILKIAAVLDPDPTVRAWARLAEQNANPLHLRSSEAPDAKIDPKRTPDRADFAVDGVPCFSSSQCRVLPPGGAKVPRTQP
jgi:hypothetical protein